MKRPPMKWAAASGLLSDVRAGDGSIFGVCTARLVITSHRRSSDRGDEAGEERKGDEA